MAVQVGLDERTSGFLAAPKKLLIDGEWVEAASGKTFATYDPASEDVLTRGRARPSRGHRARRGALRAARSSWDRSGGG